MRSVFLLLAAALASAAADIPRPEFPQPQFEREQWLNLNGRWEFEFDDRNAGLDAHWASGAKAFARSIVVPFCFESPASGINDPAFHPWIWYRRPVTLPAEWAGKRVLLHFGAVDYRAMVWVNGALAGAHEGGSVPFQFDITALLKPGANVITVRAEDPPTDRFIPRGKQYWEVQVARHLLQAHLGHLADGVAGSHRHKLSRASPHHAFERRQRALRRAHRRDPSRASNSARASAAMASFWRAARR